MLSTMVTKKVVAAGESVRIGAAVDMAIEGDLGQGLLHVFPLMTSEVLGVKEPLPTRAHVRPFITTEVNLEVAAKDWSMGV